jgi:hypothetical protein
MNLTPLNYVKDVEGEDIMQEIVAKYKIIWRMSQNIVQKQ